MASLVRRGEGCAEPTAHKVGEALVFESIPRGGVRWYFPDGCAFDVHLLEVAHDA